MTTGDAIERRAAELAVAPGDPLNLKAIELRAQQGWDESNQLALTGLQAYMDQVDIPGIVTSRMPVLEELPNYKDGQLVARRFSWLPDNSPETRAATPRIRAISGTVILYAELAIFNNFGDQAPDIYPSAVLYNAGMAVDDGDSGTLFYGATQHRTQRNGDPFANIARLYKQLTDGSYIDAQVRRRDREQEHEDAPSIVRFVQDKAGWAANNQEKFAAQMALAETWVAKSGDADMTKFVKNNFVKNGDLSTTHLLPDATMPANQDWFATQIDNWLATDPNIQELFPKKPKSTKPLNPFQYLRLGVSPKIWWKLRQEYRQNGTI